MTTKRTPLSQLVDDDTRAALQAGLAKIKAAVLEDGATIVIQGFGTFAPRDRPERMVRNPATGQQQLAAASRTVVFRATKGGK